ncbi:MAG: flagellar basal body rod protein FlgC, partial [Rhodospirillaceae bacterium]|jgi:flagellar basal body rod protein FlgC|nr:flagellar basal body rod protein FlgC [Rhodospirillaceae bacterium]MBT6474762.1 flagellar basal body rod protein FlgC [Rhodospirillaceae bacterium]
MQEAQRSYRANIKVIEAAKRMMMRTIDMLK